MPNLCQRSTLSFLGFKIIDQLTGEVHNYTNKKGLEYSEVIIPNNIKLSITANELWNKAELSENRSNSRVAREWVIALPHELSKEQRIELSKDVTQYISNAYQVGTQLVIHEPSRHGDNRNYHVHVLTTTRRLDSELNLTIKSDIELSNKQCREKNIQYTDEQIVSIRENIANKINHHLELANINEKITHKSYKDIGIDQIPTKHMGKESTYLERKGEITQIGEFNRKVNSYNQLQVSLNKVNKQLYKDKLFNERSIELDNKVNQYFTKFNTIFNEQNKKHEVLNTNDKLLKSIKTKYGTAESIIEKYRKYEQQEKIQLQKMQEKEFLESINLNKGRSFGR